MIVAAANRILPIVLFSVVAFSGCRDDEKEKVTAYRHLMSLPKAEIERRVTALTPKEQIDLYVYSLCFKPPDLTLTSILAKEGARVLPALIAELDKPGSDAISPELVMVIYQMAVIYRIDEAKILAPRVHEWCKRFYQPDSYCEQMGREMIESTPSKNP